MSASQDKKRRQTERMEGTDKRTLAEREAAQKAKTAKVLFFVTLGLVLLALVLSIISFSTGMLNGYLEEIL